MRSARVAGLALAALALVAGRARGQQPGAVRGTVYDSLAGVPLAGARVWIHGTSAGTTTDERGRYALDGVPAGAHTISFGHPDLDSIGLPHFARPVAVRPGSTTSLDLVVPALPTIQRALCGPRPPAVPYGLGAVFGTVTDAATGVRLAGARVEVSWLSVGWQPGQPLSVDRSRDEVTTDSLGNFYECDVPKEEVFTIAAASGQAATGRIEVLIGSRGVARFDLTLSRDPSALRLDSITGLLRGRATLAGTVHDELGRPVRGVRILSDDAAPEAETDDAGRFVLAQLPAGSQMVMARAIGYSASRRAVALRNGDTTLVTFTIMQVTALDTIRVIAHASRTLDQLVERLKAGNTYTLTGTSLHSAATMSTVLYQLPSLAITGNPLRGCAPSDNRSDCMRMLARSGAGECHVHIWVDGQTADEEVLTSLQTRRLIAVEWYPRASFVPWQFAPNDGCAVLLVWTDLIG